MGKPAETDLVYIISEPRELDDIARKAVSFRCPLILLTGDLGSGKTTLVKAFCRVLGSTDEVTSPTFTLINEYRDREGHAIFHVDLYRLNTVEEALDIGIEDILSEGNWCFIEWPELIRPILSEAFVEIALETLPDGRRRICILK